MTFDEWLQHGLDNKFCSEVFCLYHDGVPLSPEEEDELEEYGELCVSTVRLTP
jgi:hypothetical protein